MIDPDYMAECLRRIISATHGERITRGYWIGNQAAERQVNDNLISGRIEWQSARETAERALGALEAGDIAYAKIGLREAKNLMAAAYERNLKPSDIERVRHDAKLRGTKSEAVRDSRLVQAVDRYEAQGLSGKAARQAALEGDLILSHAFRDMTDAGIRAAIRRGRKAKL